ncbi:DUF4129 domain-containing protein [Olivibacter sp. CPCC 100613]|uniref:DUF4129 domain-containing protein n=1 Tax=Olivibacter sp. CPCC 100613 TaxID=3079931 RepID=UPI002FF85D51
MYRIYFVLLSILFFGWPTRAASVDSTLSEKDKAQRVQIDTAKLILRSFDTARLAQYKKDTAFDYEEELAPVGWWQHFKQWFYELLNRIFSNRQSGPAFKWLLIILGSTALLFLIYKIAGMDILQVFGRRNRLSTTAMAEEENIHYIDFEREVGMAIEKKNFRQAVRLLYLQLLKELTDRALIDWQPGKTNRIYVQELGEKPFSADFRNLTGLFEQAWYGAFPVRENDFFDFKKDYVKLKDLI